MTFGPQDVLRIMEDHVPFNRLLGIHGEAVEHGRAVLVLPVRAEFVGDPRRPALHGGVLSALIDTAGGVAAWSALGAGESVSTVDLRIDYLEPAGLAGPLRAGGAPRAQGQSRVPRPRGPHPGRHPRGRGRGRLQHPPEEEGRVKPLPLPLAPRRGQAARPVPASARKCCTYVAVGINAPTRPRYATDILWYLYHEKV